MNRREVITVLGGAATAWPFVARAQQPERMRRIGVLTYLAADDPDLPTRVAAFSRGLQELGWINGRNVRIEYRFGAGNTERYRDYAAELISLSPDVILVSSGSALAAVQKATRTVPIVFVNVSDPVGAGYVASLARPGANTTGFTLFEYSIGGKWLELLRLEPKRLELLRELVPSGGVVGVLVNPNNPTTEAQLREVQAAASTMGKQITSGAVLPCRSSGSWKRGTSRASFPPVAPLRRFRRGSSHRLNGSRRRTSRRD